MFPRRSDGRRTCGQRPVGHNPISDDVLITIGGLAWVVATVAAAIAYRVGAPMSAVALLGLSSIVVVHAPPVGPAALVVFATAVVLLARMQSPVPVVYAPPPTPARVSRP